MIDSFITAITQPTALGKWITSPSVNKFCDDARKEREERIQLKQCPCGNDCSDDEHNTLGFYGEYICGGCK